MDPEVEALYRTAVERFDAGDGSGALVVCQRLLEVEPDHPAALNLLGVLLAERLDHARAVAAFSRSLGVTLPMQWQNARFRACKNLQSPSPTTSWTMA